MKAGMAVDDWILSEQGMTGDAPCHSCGAGRSMSRCWRLTCPTNGGSMKLVELMVPVEARHLDEIPTPRRKVTAAEMADLFPPQEKRR